MRATQGSYVPPTVADYGDLGDLTAGSYPLLGAAAVQDLSFSAPVTQPGGGDGGPGGPGGPGGSGGPGQGVGGEEIAGGEPGGGGGGDGGGSGSGGGSPGGGSGSGGEGGELPFTGLEAGAVAAAGSALAAAGTALRRATQRRSRR